MELPFVLRDSESDSAPADFEYALSAFLRLGSGERRAAGEYVFPLWHRPGSHLDIRHLDRITPSILHSIRNALAMSFFYSKSSPRSNVECRDVTPNGLLAALLLPALNSAKSAALRTQCVSNQRQIEVALDVYVMDNADTMPLLPSWNGLSGQDGSYDSYMIPDPANQWW